MKNAVKSPAKATKTRGANAKVNAQKVNAQKPKAKSKKKNNGIHKARLEMNSNWKDQQGTLSFCIRVLLENDKNFLKSVNKEFGCKLNATFFKSDLKGDKSYCKKLAEARTEREKGFKKPFSPYMLTLLITRVEEARVNAEKK